MSSSLSCLRVAAPKHLQIEGACHDRLSYSSLAQSLCVRAGCHLYTPRRTFSHDATTPAIQLLSRRLGFGRGRRAAVRSLRRWRRIVWPGGRTLLWVRAVNVREQEGRALYAAAASGGALWSCTGLVRQGLACAPPHGGIDWRCLPVGERNHGSAQVIAQLVCDRMRHACRAVVLVVVVLPQAQSSRHTRLHKQSGSRFGCVDSWLSALPQRRPVAGQRTTMPLKQKVSARDKSN